MLLTAVLINSLHAALEDREISLNRVCCYIAARIFLIGVIDALMLGEFLAGFTVVVRFVSMETAFSSHILVQRFTDSCCVQFLHMEGTSFAATLNQRDHLALGLRSANTLPAFAGYEDRVGRPDESLVRLDDFILAAERGRGVIAHSLADA